MSYHTSNTEESEDMEFQESDERNYQRVATTRKRQNNCVSAVDSDLSTIMEESTPNTSSGSTSGEVSGMLLCSDSSSYENVSETVHKSSNSGDTSPLPELIIEKEPNRHDEPEEFYEQLLIKMKRYIRQLSGRTNISDSDLDSDEDVHGTQSTIDSVDSNMDSNYFKEKPARHSTDTSWEDSDTPNVSQFTGPRTEVSAIGSGLNPDDPVPSSSGLHARNNTEGDKSPILLCRSMNKKRKYTDDFITPGSGIVTSTPKRSAVPPEPISLSDDSM